MLSGGVRQHTLDPMDDDDDDDDLRKGDSK